MSEKEIVITYEALYEVLRREKNKPDLQKLDNSFFSDVVSYLSEKKQILSEIEGKDDVFSVSEREQLTGQISNAKRLLKELYDCREFKAVQMAVNKSRTGLDLVDTSVFLPEERRLFDSLVVQLNSSRSEILISALALKTVPSLVKAEPSSESKFSLLKFVQETEEFIGEELESYGPFSVGDTAYIPNSLAVVLLEKGMAVSVDEE